MDPNTRLLLGSNRAMQSGDYATALKNANLVLNDNPDEEMALFIAGSVMARGNDFGLALPYFERAARLNPDRFEIWNNLGACFQERHPARAKDAYLKALELKPDHVDSMSNMCAVAAALGDYDESIEWATKCLEIDPDNSDANYNSALSYFQQGDFITGFKRYKAALGRLETRQERNYHADRQTPRWEPMATSGGCVVLYGEQGLGDHILFASMIHEAIAIGPHIIIETSKRLEGLFRRSFPKATVYGTLGQDECAWPAEHNIAAKLEMGGLGEFFMRNAQRRFNAFLKPDPARVAAWKAWLKSWGKGPYIGVAWNAGIADTGRDWRSLDFADLKPLLDQPKKWVCLEYRDPGDCWHENMIYPDLHTKNMDYDDTAALIAALDGVIAPTTTAVDCAAAVGTPVDVMCPVNPPWRYSEKAGDMFFYDAPKVHRQKKRGDWSGVVAGLLDA